MDRQTADTQNVGGYNIIPRHFLWRGIKTGLYIPSYQRFDCKINVSQLTLIFHFISHKFAAIYKLVPVLKSRHHLTQGTRRGHPSPMGTFLDFFFNLVKVLF